MAASNIVVDKHSPDEFDKLSLPENLGDTTEIQQGRTYFLAGSVLKVAFSQKGLMRSSFLQADKHELDFLFIFHSKWLKPCHLRT